MSEPLFSKHGGYRRLDSFMLATIIYYSTVGFCRRFGITGRQQEQMVQAARSGRQNIAEGSKRSATSAATEINLTDVAQASLAELMLDYEDYINLSGQLPWSDDDPNSEALRTIRLKRLESDRSQAHEFAKVVAENRALFARWLESDDAIVRANALVRLCDRADWVIRRQLAALGERFIEEGGFKEKMTRARLETRDTETPKCPDCGKPLRKRAAKKGSHAGSEFWGCTGYPDCTFTRNLDDTRPTPTQGDSNRNHPDPSRKIST